MKVTLLKAMNVVDPSNRLWTEIGDVYELLNHIFSENFYTHHLHTAMDYLEKKNPAWFADLREQVQPIIDANNNDFSLMLELLKKDHTEVEIPAFDKSDIPDFMDYMLENSLLNKIGSAR